MSVFTPISQQQARTFWSHYDLPALLDWQPIVEGVSNSNFSFKTEREAFVLTIFEQISFDQLPFFLRLLQHLHEHRLPVANPIADKRSQIIHVLAKKPAVLMQGLPGKSIEYVSVQHCQQIGYFMAKMHYCCTDFPLYQLNSRELSWFQATALCLQQVITVDEQALMLDELAFQQRLELSQLPHGIIHADLFRDNTLFVTGSDQLSGVIDFYFACYDVLLLDCAIVFNDWCLDNYQRINSGRAEALLDAYQAARAWLPQEQANWPAILRRAAFRFWLSRLYDFYFPRAIIGERKDPNQMKQVLLLHRNNMP